MTWYATLLLLTWLTVEAPAEAPLRWTAANIPNQVNVLNTPVTITEAGKQKIAVKLNSLTQSQMHFKAHLDRAIVYFPVIEREFSERGVPDDFKYLALQESVLDGNAVSRSNAVGFWQFKAPTAVEYNLRVDNQIDERRNIISSSRAAAEYFKKSQHYLHNWMYALLSYNLGLTGATNYITQNNLPQQVVIDGNSHMYLVHFLAHYLAFNDAYIQARNRADIYLLEYAGGVHNSFDEIAAFVTGGQGPVNQYVSTLDEYNPWLLTDRVPENEAYCYSVVLPVNPQQRDQLIGMLKPYACGGKVRGHNSRQFYSDTLKNDYPMFVRMKEFKETKNYREILANGVRAIIVSKPMKANKVLRKMDVSEEDFVRFNDGRSFDRLLPEAVYYLEEKPDTIPLSYHVFEEGDSLEDLAQKYGIKLDKLYEWTEIDENYQPVPGDKIFFGPPA